MRRGWAHEAASTGCEDWNSSLPAPGAPAAGSLATKATAASQVTPLGHFLVKASVMLPGDQPVSANDSRPSPRVHSGG